MSPKIVLKLLIDADMLIKLSVFDCFSESIQALGFTLAECATLKSMTLSAGIANQHVRERKAGPGAPANRLLATLGIVPTIDDISQAEALFAASLTRASQQRGLAVDGGEAMLISLSIHRGLPYLTTGDKKAIRSLPQMMGVIADLNRVQGKLMPLEYVLLQLVRATGFSNLQQRLIAGMNCDGTVRNALHAADGNAMLFETELDGKLNALRAAAPTFIVP